MTDDLKFHHPTLGACHQLAQSVLKIGFEQKGGMGKVGRFRHKMPCTWRLSWLAVERPWSALAKPFLSHLTQTGVETPLSL